uniref:PH domain-containing protein n=1 Tax=Moniliophthora roreri TaxID=221103 RepID=A0A0W0EV81_MONRR
MPYPAFSTQPIESTTSLAASSSALKLEAHHHDEHANRRFFIGPMPERAVPHIDALAGSKKKGKHRLLHHSSEDGDEEEAVDRIVRESAFSYFLSRGGREEDWGENEEKSTREEMKRIWRESPWGVYLQSRRNDLTKRAANRWVGSSFEVGEIAGFNVIQEADAITSMISSRTSAFSGSNINLATSTQYLPLDGAVEQLNSPHRPTVIATKSSGQDTFVTARSKLSPNSSYARPSTPPKVSISTLEPDGSPVSGNGILPPNDSYSSSTTALLPSTRMPRVDSAVSQTRSEAPRRPIIKLPSFARSDSAPVAQKPDNKGKGKKAVRYDDLSPITPSPAGQPVPPDEVLEREGGQVEDTSAGAMNIPATPTSDAEVKWGAIELRDRMLVRMISSDLTAVPSSFDEQKHRQTRDLKYEGWGEFMVVWRGDRVELYENYTIPGEEWMRGHKNLSYVIPLKSERTRLSIYSFVDLTFCITCPPVSRRYNPASRKWKLSVAKQRTMVYGSMPLLSKRNPRLDSKVNIELPTDPERQYAVFTRKNVINLCIESLSHLRDFQYLIKRHRAEGRVFQLAWRKETHLDWIWLDEDVDGRPRDWAILCGLLLQESSVPAHLELRLCRHFPSFIRLKDGSRLPEPLPIEGYVDRIKPNSGAKQPLYLVVHDGNLFVLHPPHANPPVPLGALPRKGSTMESYIENLKKSEVQRGIKQVTFANGVADLRNILAVRRGVHPVMQRNHDYKDHPEDENWVKTWSEGETSPADFEDTGGEEALNQSSDKHELKMRRSFELLFKNGHVVRFEAYSCAFAIDWVHRLQELVHYWRLKHRYDAQDEMDLAQALRPRVTPKRYVEQDRIIYPEAPPDLSAPLPALGSLYNWCIVDGCRPILRGGKLFSRRGLHGQYRLVQMFLLPEYLVQFHVKPKSQLHLAEPRKIHLIDAYVCSGYFAAQRLPRGQYDANAECVAHRYEDGLEADDPDEDKLFIVWYKSRPKKDLLSEDGTTASATPPLDAKRKVAVFRTRSKLERDAWCWALNCAIEKIVRERKDRETKMRETGGLMQI